MSGTIYQIIFVGMSILNNSFSDNNNINIYFNLLIRIFLQ
jgi:hypothetical protein